MQRASVGKLPGDAFKWDEVFKSTKKSIKNYKNRKPGYFVEVDQEYSEQLQSPRNELFFSPKNKNWFLIKLVSI